MKTLFRTLVLWSFATFAHAGDVTWTGETDELWDTPANWDPQGAPGVNDTAIIGAFETSNTTLELSPSAYSLLGMEFRIGGFRVGGAAETTITLTGGILSSQGDDSSTNVVEAAVALTAASNTITVRGAYHELELGDLTVSGSLTTDVEGSLCLSGMTTVTGAFIKTGAGETCTGNGLTAGSATIQEGMLMVEADSSLGDVTIESVGGMVVDYGATATVGTVRSSGLLVVSAFTSGQGTLDAAGGVTIEDEGVLGGAGLILGDVTVEAGGAIEAGAFLEPDAPLTIAGNVTLEENSIFRIDIFDSTTLLGTVSLEGDFSIAGLLCVCNSGAEGLFTLVEFTGELTGTFAGIINTLPDYNYQLIYNANSVQLQVTAIPEPTAAALAIGAAVILLRRRRA
jgi:hypothetical protein